jgi:hypothetical protein
MPKKTPESEIAGLATTKFDKERQQFRALILSNPNYFGNIKQSPFKAQLNIVGDTTYEEIGSVGFQPQFNQLEATVYINQPSGYGGDVCSAGTPEFIRFYTSFDNGGTWQDQGLVSFAAHDIPGTTSGKRLEYAVTRQIAPLHKLCFLSNLALVRAILSWNVPPPPNDPTFAPVWGDVHDTHIQIEPIKLIILSDLLKEFEVKIPPQLAEVLDPSEPLPVAKPKQLSLTELNALYRGTTVEPHRFALAEIKSLVGQPAAVETLMSAGGFKSNLAEIGLNLGDLIDKLFPVDGNTTYEQLESIGLDPNKSFLVGIIRAKLPNGYSGGPCTAGSKEFVSFWADFDGNGSFETPLGTTSVNVYDIGNLPKEGLEYAVFLPVDLSAYQQPCKQGPKVVAVRAILSWQIPPPLNDPNFVPIWGNRLETEIQIQPGVQVQGQVPFLSAVGDIAEIDINATGKANGVAIHTGFVAADSPFGGVVTIAGHISNAVAGLKYRVMRKPHGAPDSDYVPLVNEPSGLDLVIDTWDPTNGWIQQHQTVHALPPIADGYYPFEDYSSNHAVEGNIMGRWFTGAPEDGQTFDLRIDLSTDGNPAHDVHSNVVTVLIDNTPPVAELNIDLGVGVQCAHFAPGANFTGHFTATDVHFRAFAFEIEPSGPPNDPPHGVLPAPASGASIFYGGPIADPGVTNGTYSVNTGRTPPVGEPHVGPMDPCGYAIILHVYDRTNVNSGATTYHSQTSVGFCLEQPKP